MQVPSRHAAHLACAASDSEDSASCGADLAAGHQAPQSPPHTSFISKSILDREAHYRKLDSELAEKTRASLLATQTAFNDARSFCDNVENEAAARIESLIAMPTAESNNTIAVADGNESTATLNPPLASAALHTKGKVQSAPQAGKHHSIRALGKLEAGLIEKIHAKIQDAYEDKSQDYSLEATNIYLKARLLAVEEEMIRLTQEACQLKSQLTKAESKAKQQEDESGKLQKLIHSATTAKEKLEKQLEDTTRKMQETVSANIASKRALEEAIRAEKDANTELAVRDARIAKSQEEIAKLKLACNNAEKTRKEQIEERNGTLDRIKGDLKRLERQKNELLVGMKKQGMLVDVLRKQKMHLEAATMLGFTEQEFRKLLDWPLSGSGSVGGAVLNKK